ncbi:MAG: hypothetical protein O3A01_00025 [bacterium]|nr:hypothetical protein [bacterium]
MIQETLVREIRSRSAVTRGEAGLPPNITIPVYAQWHPQLTCTEIRHCEAGYPKPLSVKWISPLEEAISRLNTMLGFRRFHHFPNASAPENGNSYRITIMHTGAGLGGRTIGHSSTVNLNELHNYSWPISGVIAIPENSKGCDDDLVALLLHELGHQIGSGHAPFDGSCAKLMGARSVMEAIHNPHHDSNPYTTLMLQTADSDAAYMRREFPRLHSMTQLFAKSLDECPRIESPGNSALGECGTKQDLWCNVGEELKSIVPKKLEPATIVAFAGGIIPAINHNLLPNHKLSLPAQQIASATLILTAIALTHQNQPLHTNEIPSLETELLIASATLITGNLLRTGATYTSTKLSGYSKASIDIIFNSMFTPLIFTIITLAASDTQNKKETFSTNIQAMVLGTLLNALIAWLSVKIAYWSGLLTSPTPPTKVENLDNAFRIRIDAADSDEERPSSNRPHSAEQRRVYSPDNPLGWSVRQAPRLRQRSILNSHQSPSPEKEESPDKYIKALPKHRIESTSTDIESDTSPAKYVPNWDGKTARINPDRHDTFQT